MQLNKGDIIKDGDNYVSIFCVMCSVIYVKRILDVNSSPYYELEDALNALKHCRKIEIMNN